jgi:hypothetical protein
MNIQEMEIRKTALKLGFLSEVTNFDGSINIPEYKRRLQQAMSKEEDYDNTVIYSITHGKLKEHAYFILGREATSRELHWIEQSLFNQENGQIWKLIEEVVRDAEKLEV